MDTPPVSVVAFALRVAALVLACQWGAARAAEFHPVVGGGALQVDDHEGRVSGLRVLAAPHPAPAPSLTLLSAPAIEASGAVQLPLTEVLPLGLPSPPLTMSFPGPSTGTPPDPVIAAGPDALITVTNNAMTLQIGRAHV